MSYLGFSGSNMIAKSFFLSSSATDFALSSIFASNSIGVEVNVLKKSLSINLFAYPSNGSLLSQWINGIPLCLSSASTEFLIISLLASDIS